MEQAERAILITELRSLAGVWEQYDFKVLRGDALPDERKECRRAFYAGAAAVWALMLQGMSSEEPQASEEDLSLMETINSELDQFAVDLMMGKA